jgi:hypothetical protein
MAKKTGLLAGQKLIYIGIAVAVGTGVIIAGPLLIEDFPIDVYGDVIKPFFVEPSELTTQEQQQNAQIILNNIDQTEEILCGGEGSGEAPFVDEVGVVVCVSAIEDESGEEIQEEIEEIDNGEIIETPPTNQTEFSEDPPIEQICDTDPSNIICQVAGEPTTAIILTSKIEKISSSGISEFISGEFGLNQLAFFVEESTNIDYANGRLIFELGTLSDRPNHEYSARSIDATQAGLMGCTNPTFQECIAKFDILISDQSIFTEPLELGIDRTGDDQGVARLIFLSGIGSTVESGSTDFTFNFADHFDKFGNEQITRIKAVVLELNIAEALTFPEQLPSDVIQFSTTDQQIFAMEIARDNEQIVIIDENTNATSRVFPTDSRLVITTVSKSVSGARCLIGHIPDFGPRTGCAAAGNSCTVAWFLSSAGGCLDGLSHLSVIGTSSPPTVSAVTLVDQNGQLLFNKPGGTGKIFDELLTRNENYTLLVASFPASELSYGKSQETQSYTCFADGRPNYEVYRVAGPPHLADRCGGGGCYYNYYIRVVAVGPTFITFTPLATQCTFP